MSRPQLDYDAIYKTVFIGKSQSGKSAFLLRLIDNEFRDDLPSTIVIDFGVKITADRRIKFQIWDTASDERFRSIVTDYLQGSSLIAVFIDLTRISDSIQYLDNFQNKIPENARLVIIFTKSDLIEAEKMPTLEEIQKHKEDIAKNLGVDSKKLHKHYIISSKTGENVEAAFNSFPEVIKPKPTPAFNIRWDYLNGRPHKQFNVFAKPSKDKESGHAKKGTPPLFNTKITL